MDTLRNETIYTIDGIYAPPDEEPSRTDRRDRFTTWLLPTGRASEFPAAYIMYNSIQ